MDFLTLILSIISAVFAYLASRYYSKYKEFTEKFSQFRKLIETIDNALKDQNLTKEELQQIIEDIKKLL